MKNQLSISFPTETLFFIQPTIQEAASPEHYSAVLEEGEGDTKPLLLHPGPIPDHYSLLSLKWEKVTVNPYLFIQGPSYPKYPSWKG